MKKNFLALFVSCHLVFVNVYSQPDKSDADSSKRAFFYFVKIETMGGEKTNAALSRFSADSVFVVSVDKKYVLLAGTVFKIIQNDLEYGMAADSIRIIHVRKDHNIIYADSFKSKKGKAIVRNLAFTALDFTFWGVAGSAVSAPASTTLATADFVSGTMIAVGGAVALGTLAVSKTGKKFRLNGDKEKFKEMLSELVKIKKGHFETGGEESHDSEN